MLIQFVPSDLYQLNFKKIKLIVNLIEIEFKKKREKNLDKLLFNLMIKKFVLYNSRIHVTDSRGVEFKMHVTIRCLTLQEMFRSRFKFYLEVE